MQEHWQRELWRMEGSFSDDGGTTTRRMRLEFPEELDWKLLALTGTLRMGILTFSRKVDTSNDESPPW